jgi:predicted MPP superfamily phosphohydrolase
MRISELVGVLLVIAVIFFIFGTELVYLAARINSSVTKNAPPPVFRSKYFLIIHALAIAGIICLIDGFLVEPKWIEVKQIEIETPKLKNTMLRIVQFSDTHCETRPMNEDKVVQIIHSLEPDVIVFTGDSVNTPKALPLFKETLSQINAKLGKFAVRGNFDSTSLRKLSIFSETGFRELVADAVEIEKEDESFFITGFNVPYPPDFQRVLQSVPPDKYSILLYHHSDLAESLQGFNVDLYLSGHTHGGQVRLPFYGAVVTLSRFGKKYEAGMYTIGRMKLYVNKGIGLEDKPSPKVRFLCRPEITVFDIKPAIATQEKRK